MLGKLRYLFFGTLRRQLIVSVALVHAVLMVLFVIDLTQRQQDMLLERQTEQAQALASSVATSAAGWVASRDYNGLQEIISTQSRYPELEFAMILDNSNKVIAHTDTLRIGYYLQDLPDSKAPGIISRSSALVDVVNPIILADQELGWARIGLGQKVTASKMQQILRDGLLYTLSAIVIGSIFAWMMGSRMTRKLSKINKTAMHVEQGYLDQRIDMQGDDELSHVAHALNRMLDANQATQEKLKISEERFDLAISATNDGLYDWNLDTGHVYYSPRWASMLGYRDDELEPTLATWERLVHPDDKQQVLDDVQLMIDGITRNFEAEFRIQHKDGHWIYVLSRGAIIHDAELHPIRIVGTHVDISDKKEQDQLIWRQANYDELTGLPNRKLFLELLDQQVRKAHRDLAQLWLFFLDLDGFKNVNDTYGHGVGDLLLIDVGKRLQDAVRDEDLVARLSGDEFVISVASTHDVSNVDRMANKFIDAISREFIVNDINIFVSVSIGISNYPKDAETASELLKFSDQSMYLAKRQGKNRYTYFTPALEQAARLRMEISTSMRTGISDNQFLLNYQPIVELATGDLFKAEALIRWEHPDKGIVSPAAFIPIAEETGMICDIGLWVFESAFSQIQAWKNKYAKPLSISVNMSPTQLKVNDDSYDRWIDQLEQFKIAGNEVIIEITESLLLKDESIINDRLLKYRDHGIQVAIDDFGTGYSSLSYLKEFDIDFLKIDQSFVRHLSTGSSEESLCRAIIVMAHSLGLQVIAEGIETELQMAMLRQMGCDFGQGYYFSKPVPAEEFEARYLSGPGVYKWENLGQSAVG